MLDRIKTWAQDHSAWVSALGLAGLTIYELSAGNASGAAKAAMAALTALGVHLNLGE